LKTASAADRYIVIPGVITITGTGDHLRLEPMITFLWIE
jgi:hypothetical protein